LASSRQYGNALLGVRHQEEEAKNMEKPAAPAKNRVRQSTLIVNWQLQASYRHQNQPQPPSDAGLVVGYVVTSVFLTDSTCYLPATVSYRQRN